MTNVIAKTETKEHFLSEGFAHFSNIFNPDDVSRLSRDSLEVLKEKPYQDEWPDVRLDLFGRHPQFHWMLEHEPLISALKTIFGSDFLLTIETALHDSRFGGWHRDTEWQECHGFDYHWSEGFSVGQCAIYLQSNDPDFGGGIDIVPRSHLAPDHWWDTFKLRLHHRYHRLLPKKVQKVINRYIFNLKPRPIDQKFFDRAGYSVPNKPGDLVIFNLRMHHKATHPKVKPVPIDKRKLALFFVCGENNAEMRAHINAVSNRHDYGYFKNYRHPEKVVEISKKAGFVLQE